MIFLIDISQINEDSSKQCPGKFSKSTRIARIYEIHYNFHHQGAVKVFNRTVQTFFN